MQAVYLISRKVYRVDLTHEEMVALCRAKAICCNETDYAKTAPVKGQEPVLLIALSDIASVTSDLMRACATAKVRSERLREWRRGSKIKVHPKTEGK